MRINHLLHTFIECVFIFSRKWFTTFVASQIMNGSVIVAIDTTITVAVLAKLLHVIPNGLGGAIGIICTVFISYAHNKTYIHYAFVNIEQDI